MRSKSTSNFGSKKHKIRKLTKTKSMIKISKTANRNKWMNFGSRKQKLPDQNFQNVNRFTRKVNLKDFLVNDMFMIKSTYNCEAFFFIFLLYFSEKLMDLATNDLKQIKTLTSKSGRLTQIIMEELLKLKTVDVSTTFQRDQNNFTISNDSLRLKVSGIEETNSFLTSKSPFLMKETLDFPCSKIKNSEFKLSKQSLIFDPMFTNDFNSKNLIDIQESGSSLNQNYKYVDKNRLIQNSNEKKQSNVFSNQFGQFKFSKDTKNFSSINDFGRAKKPEYFDSLNDNHKNAVSLKINFFEIDELSPMKYVFGNKKLEESLELKDLPCYQYKKSINRDIPFNLSSESKRMRFYYPKESANNHLFKKRRNNSFKFQHIEANYNFLKSAKKKNTIQNFAISLNNQQIFEYKKKPIKMDDLVLKELHIKNEFINSYKQEESIIVRSVKSNSVLSNHTIGFDCFKFPSYSISKNKQSFPIIVTSKIKDKRQNIRMQKLEQFDFKQNNYKKNSKKDLYICEKKDFDQKKMNKKLNKNKYSVKRQELKMNKKSLNESVNQKISCDLERIKKFYKSN